MARPRTFQIVIPSLNQGQFIGEAIASILAQSGDVELELIVMDGGSSDDTLAQVETALAVKHAAVTTVVSEPDDGQSHAINKGMGRGSGEIVSWLNSDDRLLPGTLAKVERFLRAAGEDVAAVYGDVQYIDASGRPFLVQHEQEFCHYDLLWGPCYIAQPSTFVRRWAWERAGGLREHLHYAMDVDLWLRLSKIGGIVHVPAVLAEFRLHPASKTVAAARAVDREFVEIQRHHAQLELGRRPSLVERQLRHTSVRLRRRLSRSGRGRA